MKKIKYVFVDPGGNATVLVLTKIARDRQPALARKIMRTKSIACEQVGFIERARSKKAIFRLQMMGGEFCANALRATAAWLRRKNLYIETSRTNKLVQIRARVNSKGRATWAETEIPLPRGGIDQKSISFNILKRKIGARLIALEGITQVLVPHKYFKSGLDFKPIFQGIYEKYMINSLAAGIIFYKKISQSRFSAIPVVFVKKTKTIVFETSCASGAVALALASSKARRTFFVKQPSGFVLRVLIDKKIRIGGAIKSIRTGTINL